MNADERRFVVRRHEKKSIERGGNAPGGEALCDEERIGAAFAETGGQAWEGAWGEGSADGVQAVRGALNIL